MNRAKSKVQNLHIVKEFMIKLQKHLNTQLKGKQQLNIETVIKTALEYLNSEQLKQNISLNTVNVSKSQQNKKQQKQLVYSSLFRMQEKLLQLEQKNERLKQQRDIELQMTTNFIKLYKREQDNQNRFNIESGLKKSRRLISSNKKSKSNMKSSRVIQENIEKLNFGVVEESRAKYCLTQRTNVKSTICLQQAQCYEPEQPQKLKILTKLRKLEKFVYKQSRNKKQQDKNMIFSLKQSPTKQYYRQQNDNLKVIQENLNIHLQMLQKYRQVPSIENLVAREETIKKKQKILNQLEDKLQKKEMELNRQRSQLLRKERNWRS